MESLCGYFENIANKTYIDKYPASIIDLHALLESGLFIEFGPGAGNDIRWLLENGKAVHELCSVESDRNAIIRLRYNLDELLGPWSIMHLPLDARYTGYHDINAAYVYANNMLHCLGNVDNIYSVIVEAYKLLDGGGVFFGRTLSDQIDVNRVAGVKRKQRELIDKELAKPPPKRVERVKEFSMRTNCSTGITTCQTVIYDSSTPEGIAILDEYNRELEERRKYETKPDKKEAFALATVQALQEGRLVGLAPEKLKEMALSAGFNQTHTEIMEHPWTPTSDFYYRFKKLN